MSKIWGRYGEVVAPGRFRSLDTSTGVYKVPCRYVGSGSRPVRSTSLIQQALRAVEKSGWVSCPVTLDEALRTIAEKATIIPTRPGEPPVGRLKATDQADAHRPSLSRRFGRKGFPLHTDGAHLFDPPDAVLLEYRQPTPLAPTLLFMPQLDVVTPAVGHALRQGVFAIGFGRATFLAHVLTEERLRFDPVVMVPRDPLARVAQRFIYDCIDNAVEYCAPGPGTTLIIDNRRTLHGRAAVPGGISREANRAMVRWS